MYKGWGSYRKWICLPWLYNSKVKISFPFIYPQALPTMLIPELYGAYILGTYVFHMSIFTTSLPQSQCLATSDHMRPTNPIASVFKSRSPSNFLCKQTASKQTKWSTKTTESKLLGLLENIIFFDVRRNLVNVDEIVQQCHSIDLITKTLELIFGQQWTPKGTHMAS